MQWSYVALCLDLKKKNYNNCLDVFRTVTTDTGLTNDFIINCIDRLIINKHAVYFNKNLFIPVVGAALKIRLKLNTCTGPP